MANKAPKLAEAKNGPNDMLDLLPGFPVRLKGKDLYLGRKVELCDTDGGLIATIEKNPTGNTEQEKSYTLELTGGHKILIPVPYFCSTSSFLLDVLTNEDIELAVPKDGPGRHYRVADTRDQDISSVRPAVSKKYELASEWQEIPLADDECLVFESADSIEYAKLYKVPHADEYILRGPQGEVLEHYFDEDEEGLQSSSGKKLFFEVKKKKFRIKGEMDFILKIETLGKPQKIEAGRGDSFDEDAPEILKSTIAGGRQTALASYRKVGYVKDQLLLRNEDNGGFNNDTVVVADGLGGHFHGMLISDYATERVLEGKGDLRKVVEDAHERGMMFTEYYRKLVELKSHEEDENDEWFQLPPVLPGSSKAVKEEKKLSVPDTVMAVVRFEGNTMKTMILGDSVIYVVRGDEIVYRSREHSVVAQQVAMGMITKRQAMESKHRSTVSTTLVGGYAPDFDKFELQPGDRAVVLSDGMVMPDSVIIDAVKDKNAEEGVKALFEEKRDENLHGGTFYDPDDGGPPVRAVSWDNGTAGVTVWD